MKLSYRLKAPQGFLVIQGGQGHEREGERLVVTSNVNDI